MKKTVLFSFIFVMLNISAQQYPSVTKIETTYPSESAYVFGTGEQLSGQQFQTDGIVTYKGYQYAVYYNLSRNVCIARRKMPVGAWEEVVLSYKNSQDDAHNVIVVGICPNDGSIHLAYDHHNHDLHYCYSIKGSANEPENMPWEAASFSATTNRMDKAIPNVTYPRFITKPDGNLLFECRFRWSGYGDSYLREYDATTKEWSLIGRYVQGEDVVPDACAYINGMTYDQFGRLHVTWCWRDDFGGGSNHDFYYAYSEDHGRTWKNDKGTATATTSIMDPVYDKTTGACLGQTKKEFMVEEIAYNRGYINQETQDVDSKGRIFAVNSHIPDGQGTDSNWDNSRTKARLHLRFLKEDKTWVKRMITYEGSNSIYSTRRVHIAMDSYDNAYVIANGAGVFVGSPVDDYANWKKISDDGKSGYYSEPLVDKPLLKEKGVLSFVYLSADKKIAVFDYLTKNPNTPNGTGLKAEYFSDDSFSSLISSETVATPDQSSAPAGTNSIRWSGTFETLLGEEYTLYIDAAGKTNIYVNDHLAKIMEGNGSEEEFKYSLIASHQNNIVIESKSASPVTLSWSSQHTTKAKIPATSLYSEKTNDKPGAATPPVLKSKVELDEKLLSEKKTIHSVDKTILFEKAPFEPAKEYSLEVKTKINAATGRGLDIDTRAANGKGFRLSLDRTSINSTNPLSDPQQIAAVDNAEEQVYRFAIKDDNVYIYRDKEYIGATDLSSVKDIQADGTEAESAANYGDEVIGEWAGANKQGTGKPTDYGWDITDGTVPWNTANATSGVRYLDVNASSNPAHPLNGSAYTGRLLTLRWDGGFSGVYYYPATLEANKSYHFSMVYEHWNNGTIGVPITVGISKEKNASGIYESQAFSTVEKNTLQQASFKFTSKEAGQYYIAFYGASGAMCAIGDMSLKTFAYESRLLIGKNYTSGLANIEINYISVDYSGAFAPGEASSSNKSPVQKSNVTIYTVGNQLHIESLDAISKITVFNLLGQVHANPFFSKDKCQIELSKGIYVVKIRTEKEEIGTKVMVK